MLSVIIALNCGAAISDFWFNIARLNYNFYFKDLFIIYLLIILIFLSVLTNTIKSDLLRLFDK